MNQPVSNNIDSLQIIQVKPIGIVKNRSKGPSWGETLSTLNWRDRAARMKEQRESVSELVIDAGLDGILDGIEEFSHIMVLYWAHLVPPEKRSTAKVHPMGDNYFPLVGVFATRSPARPNPILTTVARLIERKGNVLKVTGLDALDGSPILDIKPYNTDPRELDNVRIPAWMQEIQDEFSKD